MVFAPLAAMAGTALVQVMVTDDWDGVRLKVARLFGRGTPGREIRQKLDATRQQLPAASPQAQAELAAEWQAQFEVLLANHPHAGTELIALVEKVVEDLKSVIASAGTTPQAIPDSRWQTEMQNFIVGRYDRVQAAAQTWLTIMTTLFGVFSTVVVVSGARTIKEIKGGLPWQIGVAAAGAAVFVLAFVATMYGLFASWGGLGAELTWGPVPDKKRQSEQPKNPVWRKLTDIWRVLTDIWQELKDMWSPEDLTLPETIDPDWQNYRRKFTVNRANKNRKRLHRSRVLGVAAVTCTGLLALALITNGFIR